MDLDLDAPSPSPAPPDPGAEPVPHRPGQSLPGSNPPSSWDGLRPILSCISLGPAGILAGLIGLSWLWSYWPTLGAMARQWSQDPRYSHGFLVAPFALYLLWARRQLRPDPSGPRWPGLILLAGAGALRLLGAYTYFSWFEAISLLIALTGIVAIRGGWATVMWAWPSLAFLIFMVPLPYKVETALGFPLQRMATEASTYALQVFGLPAFSSGNTIVIDDFRIGVVNACNGLGMSYMFLALSVATAIMVSRPPLDRLLLILGAIPIALVVNVARIVATGLLHVLVGQRIAKAVYHDLAGWLMMLLTLGILFIECRLFSHLFIEVEDDRTSRDHPREELTRSREPAVPKVKKSPLIPVMVGIVLIVGSGVIDGIWTGRWKDSNELKLAVGRLDRVPMTIGDWAGRSSAVNPREILAAELDGCVMRRYENTRTQRAMTLVIVCGRPGPVSLHTPEICYPGVGYEMVQERPETFSVPVDSRGDRTEFSRADFEQHATFPPERIRIYWSWKSKGTWIVPYSPRVTFGSQPFLYKLYLIQRTSGGIEAVEDTSFADFLQQLLPELDQVLDSHRNMPLSQ